MTIFRRVTPNRGFESRWCRQKSRFSRVVNAATTRLSTRCCRRRLLFTGEGRRSFYKVFMASTLPKTTEQHLIVCSGKSEAEVTNNRIVHYQKQSFWHQHCGCSNTNWKLFYFNDPLFISIVIVLVTLILFWLIDWLIVHLRYCTIETNYWQTRSIAQPLCDSRATCISLARTTQFVLTCRS